LVAVAAPAVAQESHWYSIESSRELSPTPLVALRVFSISLTPRTTGSLSNTGRETTGRLVKLRAESDPAMLVAVSFAIKTRQYIA
jgi:hypothetical protein